MAVMTAHQGTAHCTETTVAAPAVMIHVTPAPAVMSHITPAPAVMSYVTPAPAVMSHVTPAPAVVRHVRPKALVPDGRTVLNLDLQVVTTQHSLSHIYGFWILHFLGGN